MIAVEQAEQIYVSRFEQCEKQFAGAAGAWLLPARRAAMARFAALGFPTTRHEEWGYTNVAPIAQTAFAPAGPAADVHQQHLRDHLFGGSEVIRLVFVNGRFSPALSSDPQAVPAGVRVRHLAAALDEDRGLLEDHLARYAAFQDSAFCGLNTALFSDGAFVHVAKGQVLTRPIHALYVTVPSAAEPAVTFPRTLVLADRDSQLTVVESYVGLGEGQYLTTAVTEVCAAENAFVDHYKLQREGPQACHVAALQFHQQRSSNVVSHVISLGGRLARNDISTFLDGEGCDCTLKGLNMLSGTQHVDNHLWVEHAKPHCDSREFFKGIYDDQSRGVFSGRIRVHHGANKTDAKQTNMSLLLSEQALADSKPQLEIFNDDVKCTHGATIGQIDEEALFYLRSRGISLQAARSLLVYAFARETIEEVKIEPLRHQLEELLLARLPQGELLRGAV